MRAAGVASTDAAEISGLPVKTRDARPLEYRQELTLGLLEMKLPSGQ